MQSREAKLTLTSSDSDHWWKEVGVSGDATKLGKVQLYEYKKQLAGATTNVSEESGAQVILLFITVTRTTRSRNTS